MDYVFTDGSVCGFQQGCYVTSEFCFPHLSFFVLRFAFCVLRSVRTMKLALGGEVMWEVDGMMRVDLVRTGLVVRG